MGLVFHGTSARAGFLESCRATFHGLLKGFRGPEKSDFTWTHGELSDAQWRYGKKYRRGSLRPGSTIRILDWDHLVKWAGLTQSGGRYGYKGQLLQRNQDIGGDALIQASTVDTNPHEVSRFTIVGADGSSHVGSLFEGGKYQVPLALITRHFHAETQSAEAGGTTIREVIYDHSHPLHALEVRFPDGNGVNLLAPLGKDDFAVAEELSAHVPYVVSFRAVLPNGFAFKASFRNGKQIATVP